MDVEPVFGQIKHNHALKRLGLRGLSKNTTDWGLVAITSSSGQPIRK
ncbi:transposase [Bacillus sp. Y40]